jgi:hypothetical protein
MSTNILAIQTKVCIVVDRVGRVRIRESGQPGIGNGLDEGLDSGASLAHVAVETEGVKGGFLLDQRQDNDGVAGVWIMGYRTTTRTAGWFVDGRRRGLVVQQGGQAPDLNIFILPLSIQFFCSPTARGQRL